MADPNLCGVCGGLFHRPAMLTYPDSPRSAQGFLDSPEQPDEVVRLEIFQCQCCGLVQHDLPPVSYYKDVIRAVAFSKEMGEFRVEQLGNWLQHFNLREKRLLEVGCGKGEYIGLLQQAGARDVYGVENAPLSVAEAKRSGYQVAPGYMAPGFANPWPERFDGFAIFSFMEHWPDLNGSLRTLHDFLNEGAVGLVEVPNFEFIVANGLYSEFTVDHIFYFDRQTLRTVLELNGYEVIAIDAIWHGYILSAQVRKRVLQKPVGFIAKQQRIIEQLHAFAGRFGAGEVVVWGAGHQALAVMSLAKLQTMVAHVVDSAPFKQNKYTPGTHLLIKSPSSLLLDCPKAVVIMAAAYSDEVAQTIERAYPQIEHVAILREEQLEVVKGG